MYRARIVSSCPSPCRSPASTPSESCAKVSSSTGRSTSTPRLSRCSSSARSAANVSPVGPAPTTRTSASAVSGPTALLDLSERAGREQQQEHAVACEHDEVPPDVIEGSILFYDL